MYFKVIRIAIFCVVRPCYLLIYKVSFQFTSCSKLIERKSILNMDRRVLAVPPVTPLPQKPDISLYQHLTEKERMMQGFPYNPFDPELVALRKRARDLKIKFNNIPGKDDEGRREVLKELLHPACKDSTIYFEPSIQIDYGCNTILGDNFQANFNCVLLDSARIEVGDNCLFGPNVQLYTATHPIDALYRQWNDDLYELAYPIKIGDNCWLGGMCVVLPGVTIGNNVVAGAGSVITKDVPDNCVVAGNPAKVVRHMPPRETVTPKRERVID